MTELEMKDRLANYIRKAGGKALSEWPLNGRARVDMVAAFSGRRPSSLPSYGFYELKSDRDTLKRLDRQIARYFEVSPMVSVVVAESHLGRVFQVVKCSDVGIARIETDGRCFWIRPPRFNPERLNPRQMFAQLRKPEREQITGIKDNGRCGCYAEQLEKFKTLELSDILVELSEVFVRRALEREGKRYD